MAEEGDAVRVIRNLRGGIRNSEPYVRFSVKFPHFRRRHDLPPLRTTTPVVRRVYNLSRTVPAPAAVVAASDEPLLTSVNAPQGVAQVSNGVSLLNLGGNPNPAAADSSAAPRNNNY